VTKRPGLNQTKSQGWRVTWKDDGTDYPRILDNFRSGGLTGRSLSTGSPHRRVFRVETEGRAFVVKHDLEVDSRFEKKIWQWLAGSPYSRLIKFTNRAMARGCPVAQNVYLVAERLEHGLCREAWLIAEFVEGTSFIEEYDANGEPVKYSNEKPWVTAMGETLAVLHDYGLASNDFHPGNFILTPQGLKIIDLAVDGPLIICQINDAVTMRHFYQVTPPMRSRARRILYALMRYRRRFKKWFRRIRGRQNG